MPSNFHSTIQFDGDPNVPRIASTGPCHDWAR